MEENNKKYLSFLQKSTIKYEDYTCTGGIIPGSEGPIVLDQFKWLFQMLEFKTEFNSPNLEIYAQYRKHNIEIVIFFLHFLLKHKTTISVY